jgi:hypothetical protein
VYQIDPQLKSLAPAREQIVAIVESINQPQVIIPGRTPQAAQAYVAGLRNPNATFSIYIYLWLSQSREAVIYSYHLPQFALEEYREAESEALHFVESMGFMMDNLNFRNLSAEAQKEIYERVPVFGAPPRAVEPVVEKPRTVAGGEADQKLARLLAAF